MIEQDDEMANERPTNTRAPARAREAPTILRIRPMEGVRTPRILLDIRLPGGAIVVFALARRQGGALELRAPQAADGGAGVQLTKKAGMRLADLAIQAAQNDPVARKALRRS